MVDVDRGGQITWHGPGQLVGYPIVQLREPMDVVGYVRSLEEALIRTCAEFGVTAQRIGGRSGAWVTGGGPGGQAGRGPGGQASGPGAPGGGRPGAPGGGEDRKVGAIGARVARGVTMHGFALNCDCDLSWFGRIVPCGISDAGVTSLTAETGRRTTVADALGDGTPPRRRARAPVWRGVEGTQALTGDLIPAARLTRGFSRTRGQENMTTGPEDRRAAADRGRLRAAHADREQVLGALRTAFVDGRLTKDELDARAAQAFGARTVADLAKLTADIPAGRAAAPLARPAAPTPRPLARTSKRSSA